MNYNMELFWRRAANLWKAHQTAQDPDFKRIWMDKLQSLMQGIKGVDKKEGNGEKTNRKRVEGQDQHLGHVHEPMLRGHVL